jgi:hypothetical protein
MISSSAMADVSKQTMCLETPGALLLFFEESPIFHGLAQIPLKITKEHSETEGWQSGENAGRTV